jgi:purine catabolism regulator
LEVPALARGAPEIVAGEGQLDRPVRWAHAGEVRNMASLLKGGELLLTTGMGLQTHERHQRRFISELAAREVAGLVIELGTSFDVVPQALREQADADGLPVIALRREVPFIEITEALHQEILNRQFVMLRRADDLHRRFTELVLNGAGIPEVLAALADAIANPVVLQKADEGILYHARYHSPSSEVLARWNLVEQGLPGAPPTISVSVVTRGGEPWGQLVVIGLDSPLEEIDRLAVERVVGLISLALLRSREEEILAARERGNLLADLLENQVDESEAAARAVEAGFQRRSPLLLPIAVRRAPRIAISAAGHEEFAWALVSRDVRRELETLGSPAIAGTRPAQRDMLLVIGLDAEGRREELAERAAAIIHASAERHLHSLHAAVVAVGAVSRSWSELRANLIEAVELSVAAAHGPIQLWHDATHPDLHSLFWGIKDSKWLRRFVERRLALLIEHDRQRKSMLLPTLEAYCAHGGRKAETARALHLERQSLYHRLERIERILGEDLSDQDTLFGLALALRARAYVQSPANGSPAAVPERV